MNDIEQNFKKYMRTKNAAKFLGVSRETLVRWSKEKKITSYLHPVNNYRLFKEIELKEFLCRIKKQ